LVIFPLYQGRKNLVSASVKAIQSTPNVLKLKSVQG